MQAVVAAMLTIVLTLDLEVVELAAMEHMVLVVVMEQ
jgi:hypothetical protein